LDRADPGMAVAQLAGVRLCVSDELLQRPYRQGRMDGDAERIDGDARDRLQVLDRVVERAALQKSLVDVWQRAAEKQRVAVGLGACDRRRAEGSAAAADVVHDHRAEKRGELVRQGASDGVV